MASATMNPLSHSTICAGHGCTLDLHCISCRTQLCRLCVYYSINSRPWCTSCAQQYLPTRKSEIFGNLRFLLEILGLIAVATIGFLLVPGVVPKVSVMGLFSMVYFYFVLLRHFGDSELVI
jgi:hypothetical protein